MHDGADDLPGLMTLAGDNENVACRQRGDGIVDGGPAVADFARARRTRQRFLADRGRIFAARIVVGDECASSAVVLILF